MDPTILTEGFHVAGKNVHIVTKFSFLLGTIEQLKLMINTQVYSYILKAFQLSISMIVLRFSHPLTRVVKYGLQRGRYYTTIPPAS